MSVKLLTLKSTEDVIADVQEMIVEEKVVGYYLKYPCKVRLIADIYEQKGSTRLPSKIQLLPYMPLSKEKMIPVVADWVVTITEPVDQLLNMYIDGVNKYEAPEDFNTDEQSETSDAD
jgi:hypothetical protein|tara:strand:+ start:227 stop:580 length:354 start_codon:yes stop_codon:yes gene_type:complete